MEIAPRLLSLAVAVAFVFANPYGVRTQSTPSKPTLPSASATAAPDASAAKPASAPVTPAPAPAPAVPAAAGPELEPHGYTYTPDGRRDPFVSLLRRGSNTLKTTQGVRPAGLLGLETSEITLKGTIASQGGFVGILQGSDNKTYIVRAGERLLDGTIRTITQDSMVITQQVTDPLSLEKQREVRKVLRQTEEAK
jgi:type IV pilus assembly protein PilP